ncbi:DUF3375 domain-containing protein [Cupriavidus nantongensis]|uniref:DUF3375 domain-containing protein n=1 Tax=Cupriavidus nantongensis TaxID=1796606 RepID=UPI0035900261
MSSVKTIAQLRQLREQALWKLLASHNAPVVLAVLQELLLGEQKMIPASALHERLTQELQRLKQAGEDMAQTPQAYIAAWLSEGWLSRRLPVGAPEEQYELTTDAITAIRFLQGVIRPRAVATESRLATVMQQLTRLADDTNPDPGSRREALLAERARIDRQLEDLGRGIVDTLSTERALERTREVIALADDLTADFRRVRDDFDSLNRQLRADVLNNEGSRGQVLEQLFAGMDLIGESPAGKTFYAFWRLLTDIEQSTIFSEALTEVVSRDFAKELSSTEKRFLRNLTNRLVDEGGLVHEVLQTFSRSLRTFVQSREYLEQRRFAKVLRNSQRDALAIKDDVRTNQDIGFELWMTSARLRSASQWNLYDPAERMQDASMRDAPESSMSLQHIADMVRNSEIDFALLRRNIYEFLREANVVGIDELVRAYPPTQGLGSVVGYIYLAIRHGQVTPSQVKVSWCGMDGTHRAANVPLVYFLKEKQYEFSR